MTSLLCLCLFLAVAVAIALPPRPPSSGPVLQLPPRSGLSPIATISSPRSPTPIGSPRSPRRRRRGPRNDQHELKRALLAQTLYRYKRPLYARFRHIVQDAAALARCLDLARVVYPKSGQAASDFDSISESQAAVMVQVALDRGRRLTGQYAGDADLCQRSLFGQRYSILSDLMVRAEQLAMDICGLLATVPRSGLAFSPASYAALELLKFKLDLALELNLDVDSPHTALGMIELFDLTSALRHLPALELRP